MVQTFLDARNLALRFRDGETFRHYVERRLHLVLPLALLALGIAIACGIGVFAWLVAHASWLALPGIALAPVVIIGSLIVLLYVLFSWFENRAIDRASPHAARAPARNAVTTFLARYRIALGNPPPFPWLALAVFVFVPWLALATMSPNAAIVILLLAVAAPLAFARLDR